MEQGDTDGIAAQPASAFVFVSRPACSLTKTQERLTFWGLAVLCFGIAIAFAALGFWMILPFAGLEVGLLAWALETMRNSQSDYETLTIDGDKVVLDWRIGRHVGHREMNRQWVRVGCECLAPGKDCRLRLSSHGTESELGSYLNDEARQQLAAILKSKLQG